MRDKSEPLRLLSWNLERFLLYAEPRRPGAAPHRRGLRQP